MLFRSLYNLGNAYYRNEQKGLAMAAYLAARNLLPRNPDIRANLSFVHKEIRDNLDIVKPKTVMTTLGFWLANTTPKEMGYSAIFFWCLGFLVLLLATWVPRLASARTAGIVIVSLSALLFLGFSMSAFYDEEWGAVTSTQADVLSGPGVHNTVVFELHEGAPFVVKRQENEWYQIELSDGKKGWIPLKDCRVFPTS